MEIMTLILSHMKYYFSWMIAWAVLHFFELEVGKMKFNGLKFAFSILIFWFLTQFSKMFIFGYEIVESINEDKILVLSIGMASFLYLFIPFVMQKENRSEFILSIMSRFGFERKKDK